jgi:hypothetical protein
MRPLSPRPAVRNGAASQLGNIFSQFPTRKQIGITPTAFRLKILENSEPVPISALRTNTKGQSMIDREVARLRRLRDGALRVREIARRLGAARWGADEPLLERGACASWRIVRVTAGKLIEHPYLGYQQGAGVGSLIGNRLAAEWIAWVSNDRSSGLKAYASELESLSRLLSDARALTRSTDFSDTLGRSQSEIATLLRTLAAEIHDAEPESGSVPLATRKPARAARAQSLPGTDGLAGGFEGDWPYLAF